VLWRVGLVSALIVIGTFGMFAWAMRRGLSLEEARTIAVNTIVVLEIAYLFSVRFLHLTSVSVQGILGTPAVLITVGLIVLLQLVLTYTPFMHVLFATRPVAYLDGLAIIGVGAALLAILEVEKLVRRRLAVSSPHGPGSAMAARP
jgi:magnesium-transporting ATPase (P-type)